MLFLFCLSIFCFSCSSKKATSVFYILNNQNGYSLRINGKPLSDLQFYKPGLDHFEPSYHTYSPDEYNTISILKENKVIFEKTVSPGSYVINATENHWVSFYEVKYGAPLEADAVSLSKQKMGVYLISYDVEYAAFGFYSNVPNSMMSQFHTARYRKFIKLQAGIIDSLSVLLNQSFR